MDNNFISSEYQSGRNLADSYHEYGLQGQVGQIAQMRLFREIAKESDFCIMGFIDGLTD